ncbi:MAG: hypothetical protein NTX97_10185 [Bacteroidetes bacterium]|nr:hypothetical protein [Bacteroidota bacterium]
MSIFKNIKQSIANRALKQELKAFQKNVNPNKFNFDKIKTVGIVFDATSAEDYEIVKRYVVYLREHLKKVKVVGFFSTKEIPALTYSKLEYDFFSAKELNWMGTPNSVVIRNFINEEFDLLIDLNINDHFALKYISSLSKAAFKVGKYNEKDVEIYDMMIDADNTKTVKYFLRQIDTYISMLNRVDISSN